jgi:Dolichyl-phosphate-mannose-protein mannosyltransferase
MKMKKTTILAVILLAGVALRLWGLGYGLPETLHPDEPIVVNHALAFGTGDLNPHFFIVPPFCSYLLFACYTVFFVVGKLFGTFSDTAGFALLFFKDPTIFYLIGRMVLGVIPGSVGIWIGYRLYRNLFPGEGAICAAAIISAAFVCVINSHYAYLDNMLMLTVLLVYLSLTRLMKNPCVKTYLLAGILFGLAVGVKYNAAVLIVACGAAHMAAGQEKGWSLKNIIFNRLLIIAGAAAICTFIISNPFSILDWQNFSGTIFGGIRHGVMGWGYHIKYSLFQGIGMPLTITGIIGCFAIMIREGKWRGLFFISFPVTYYLHLVFASQRFARYVVPLVPFLAIGAAYLIFEVLLVNKNGVFKRIAIGSLLIILIAPTLSKAVKADILFSTKDTRVVAADWIHQNIPPGTHFAVDSTSFRPRIKQSKEQLLEKYGFVEKQEGMGELKNKKLEFMLKTLEDVETYNVFFLIGDDAVSGQFLSTVPAIKYSSGDLRDNEIEYISINNSTGLQEKIEFLKGIDAMALIVKEFSPYIDGKMRTPFDNTDMTHIPISSKELFSRTMTGPGISIYKLKGGADEK